MFKSTYLLKLEDKRKIVSLIKYNIYIKKIKYQKKSCLLYVDEINYLKLKKYFKIYNISLIEIYGKNKYILLLKKYSIFILCSIMGLVLVYILSNIVFDIEIMTNNREIKNIIELELDKNHLKKYYFVKSFDEKEIIKKRILSNYKDKIEWLEIERIGTKYVIRVLERIISDLNKEEVYQNVISKRNAVIKEIKASNGEIIKKINDYVNKGEVIISGNIIKNEEIKKRVSAQGKVYGETWYKVKVLLPHSYINKVYTGNEYKALSINIFNKKICLFCNKKYTKKEYIEKPLFRNNLLPLSINIITIKEIRESNSIYTYEDVCNKALDLAREKLLSTLSKDSQILFQKKLKLYEENSTIVTEVFFKVYEDITDYEKILKEEGE